MAIDSSKNNAPPKEEELIPAAKPLRSPKLEQIHREELAQMEKQQIIKNAGKNQDLARRMIFVIICFLALMSVAAFIASFFNTEFSSWLEKFFTPIQYALFTFLGFLFGEKSTNGKQA